jgi:hypothetical protein
MNAPLTDADLPFETIAPRWRGPESPKAFFQFLRADCAYFHRVFAKWLSDSGFEIRWITKRVNFHVWNLHLLRGTVLPGCEEETARQVISTTLRRCGCGCRKKEIEVSVIGNRVGAAFIFPEGHTGSLVFSRRRASWCADDWP